MLLMFANENTTWPGGGRLKYKKNQDQHIAGPGSVMKSVKKVTL